MVMCMQVKIRERQCMHMSMYSQSAMKSADVDQKASKRQNQPSVCIHGYHISLVRRNVVSDCTKTGLVGMRRPARGICAHSEIGEESQCRAGCVSF